MSVRQARDSNPVLAKLWRLRWYFTRAELGEATLHHDPEADRPSYDVMMLGLAPHPRESCGSCQAVGT